MQSAIATILLTVALGSAATAQGVDDRICQGRETCELIATHAAGVGENGTVLTVLELGFAAEDGPDDGGWGCRFDADGYEGGREYWLVTDDGVPPDRLATICNDGYGAAMVGEDYLAFGDNRMDQERYGGSAWRWVDAISMSLRPRRLLTHYLCSAYGPWTRNVAATDWRRAVTWYAWSPASPEDETEWCPALDPTEAQPVVPEPYLLGAMVPGYEVGGLSRSIAVIGSCGLHLADAEGPKVPDEPSLASLAVVALSDTDALTVRMVVAVSRDLLASAGDIRLDVARAEYEALDWLAGEREEPSPYRTFSFPTDASSGAIRQDEWRLSAGTGGPDHAIFFLDRDPAADRLEIDLLGVVVTIMDRGDPIRPLVSTVTWQDGAPAHTPPIAWRLVGEGWPACRLSDEGVLELDGPATSNPLDTY
ncbi:MAG: hypothetical protein AAFX92_21340 [Pseudomonadota bacterium]